MVLVNNVLDSLPTYVISLFPLPTKVEKSVDPQKKIYFSKNINTSSSLAVELEDNHVKRSICPRGRGGVGGLSIKDTLLKNKLYGGR